MTNPIVLHTATDIWTKLAAIGTLVAALATLSLAFLTHVLARRTNEMAAETKAVGKATGELADQTADMARETASVAEATRLLAEETKAIAAATRDEAEATLAVVKETERDRDLQWRPALSVILWRSQGNIVNELEIVNAGGGPAIGVRYLVRDGRRWAMLAARDIPAGGQTERASSGEMPGEPDADLFAPPEASADHRGETIAVLLCSDALGRRYRFPYATGPTGGRHWYPPEMWTPGSGTSPPWSTPPYLWPL